MIALFKEQTTPPFPFHLVFLLPFQTPFWEWIPIIVLWLVPSSFFLLLFPLPVLICSLPGLDLPRNLTTQSSEKPFSFPSRSSPPASPASFTDIVILLSHPDLALFQGSIAKKPYNPIIGETFHCSWDLPSSSDQSNGAPENSRVTFVAEQVSHHPPGE